MVPAAAAMATRASRDPALVLEDVLDEKVSLRGRAGRDYGVAIDRGRLSDRHRRDNAAVVPREREADLMVLDLLHPRRHQCSTAPARLARDRRYRHRRRPDRRRSAASRPKRLRMNRCHRPDGGARLHRYPQPFRLHAAGRSPRGQRAGAGRDAEVIGNCGFGCAPDPRPEPRRRQHLWFQRQRAAALARRRANISTGSPPPVRRSTC